MAAAEARGGEFPVGMKVLVVDDDPTCLLVLKRMLLDCRYDGEQLPRSSSSPLFGCFGVPRRLLGARRLIASCSYRLGMICFASGSCLATVLSVCM